MKKLIYILLFCLPTGGFSQGFLINSYSFGCPSDFLLLDCVPDAAVAYSLRKLDKDYAGFCLRIRRASDNSTQNIGFVSNYFDTAAVRTFCTGTSCFVSEWHNQAGDSIRSVIATSSANQPLLFASDTFVTQGGNIALQFDATDRMISTLDTIDTNPNVPFFHYTIATHTPLSGSSNVFGIFSAGTTVYHRIDYIWIAPDSIFAGSIFTNPLGGAISASDTIHNGQKLHFFGADGYAADNTTVYFNDLPSKTVTHNARQQGTMLYSAFGLLRYGAAVGQFTGKVSEAVHFLGDKANDIPYIKQSAKTQFNY